MEHAMARETAAEADEAREKEAHAMLLLRTLMAAVDTALAAQIMYKLIDRLLSGNPIGALSPAKLDALDARNFTFEDFIARARAKSGRIDLLDPAVPNGHRTCHIVQAPEHIRANLLRAASLLDLVIRQIVTEKPLRFASGVPVPDPNAKPPIAPITITISAHAWLSAGLVPVVPSDLHLDLEHAWHELSVLASPQSPFARQALAKLAEHDPFLALLAALPNPNRTFARFKLLKTSELLYDEPTRQWLVCIAINYDAALAALHDAQSKSNSNSKSNAKSNSNSNSNSKSKSLATATALNDHLQRKLAACVALARMALALDPATAATEPGEPPTAATAAPRPGAPGAPPLALVRYYIPEADEADSDHSEPEKPEKPDAASDARDADARPAKVART